MIDVVRTIPSGLSFSPRKRSGRSFSWSRIAITELSIARGSFSFSLSLSLFPRELPPIIMGRSAAGDSGEIAIEMSTVEVPSLSPPCIHRVNKCWGQFFFSGARRCDVTIEIHLSVCQVCSLCQNWRWISSFLFITLSFRVCVSCVFGHASDRLKVENLYMSMFILYEFKVAIFWLEDSRSREMWTILGET